MQAQISDAKNKLRDAESYRQLVGTSTLNVRLGKGLNLAGSFSARHHNYRANSLQRDSNRVALSLSFSPGEIPISFH